LLEQLVNMQFRLTNSQRYLVNAKPGTNHSTKPTNPNGNSWAVTLTLLTLLLSTVVNLST